MAAIEKAQLSRELAGEVSQGVAEPYRLAIHWIRDLLGTSEPLTLMDRLTGIQDVVDALAEAFEQEGIKEQS